ncbi:MAG TPA: toll/interleukin-1 receptor domain-containing protein [Pyrinomonadaceae bacterium]|jgi:hypothetical protein
MKQERDDFRYEAFISYATARGDKTGRALFDRKVAVRLHRALESYRVPRALVRAAHLPRRLKRVFRDRDELKAASSLGDSLSEALGRSRYLIVICSPRARRSQWVNYEIEAFRKLRGPQFILPLLIEGEPAEAFPQALLGPAPGGAPGEALTPAQPLAADIRAGSDARALRKLKDEKLRLIAAILGCEYDDLQRREHRRFVRRALAAGAAMAALLLLLAGLSLSLFWAERRARRNYELALRGGSWVTAESLPRDTPELQTVYEAVHVHNLTDAARTFETLRHDDPYNEECLETLRGLYSLLAAAWRNQAQAAGADSRAEAAAQADAAFQKGQSVVVPVLLSRLRAYEPTAPPAVHELSGDSLSFPADAESQQWAGILRLYEFPPDAVVRRKDAADYTDLVTQYLKKLDTSQPAGRAEARRVLQQSLELWERASRQEQLSAEEAELRRTLRAVLADLRD